MIIAGIDLGTLTGRLLIVESRADKSFRVIDSDRQILRLGEGVDQNRQLSLEAMKRVVEKLKEWKTKIEAHPVDAVVVVATSAVREALNQGYFLALVKNETGFDIEVLSGEGEARRTLRGIEFGLPPDTPSVLGLDIGGGSTEFILSLQEDLPIVASLDIGVVRLTERFMHSDPPKEEEVARAKCFIQEELEGIPIHSRDLTKVTLVGTAGTITTLAAMAQRLPKYEPTRIHHYWLSLNRVCELEDSLRSHTAVERAQLPGLEPGREGVIVAGTIILRTVMETLGFKHCLVSDYGLREGIIVEAIHSKGWQ